MARTFLVTRFGALGDIILTSAPVLNLRLAYPSARILYLTRERFRPLVEMFGAVDEVITVSDQPTLPGLGRVILELDDRKLDGVIDLHGSLRSWLVKRLVTSNSKFSYPKRRRERFQLVRSHRIPEKYTSTIDAYNQAIVEAGGRVIATRAILHLRSDQPRELDLPGGQMVVIAPGAAHANKQWPLERFAQTAAKIHQEHGVHVVWLVAGARDSEFDLGQYLPRGAYTVLVDCPLEKLSAVIAKADVTIANDSGIAHLSTGLGTPVLAIFGPTHPALGFAPGGAFDRVIQVDESCRPCSLHGRRACYREQRFCFTRITPDEVAAQAREILVRNMRRTRALILDRDGTVIVNKHYLSDPEGVQLEATVLEALTIAQQQGWKVVIVSNQSGVARGMFSVDQVERVNGRLLQLLAAQGVRIDGLWYCPHHPDKGVVPEYAIECTCRKPGSGMIEQAAKAIGFMPRDSVVIGDHLDDYLLGKGIGAKSLLVRTGHGRATEEEMKRAGVETQGIVYPNLLAAVNSLESRA